MQAIQEIKIIQSEDFYLKQLKFRALINQHIREFFSLKSVLEVETPMLSNSGNPDPALLSFSTQYHGPGPYYQQEFYLNTSPEFAMKRLLAQGSGAIYSLAKVFRDGECGARHNPEFTLLEWYQPDYSLDSMINETIELINTLYTQTRAAAQLLNIDVISISIEKVTKIKYRDLFLDTINIDPMLASLAELQECISLHNIDIDFIAYDKDEYLDIIISHIIEPKLELNSLTVVYNYPASQAALAQTKLDDGFYVGARFEIYWQGLELANGFHELGDSDEMRTRFLAQNKIRIAKELKPLKIDDAFLSSLNNLPDCSGIALGLDRLIMCLLGCKSISEILSIDFNNA